MSQKLIAVPGVGNVAFPDSMSDEDIAGVIRKQNPQLKPQSPVITFTVPETGKTLSLPQSMEPDRVRQIVDSHVRAFQATQKPQKERSFTESLPAMGGGMIGTVKGAAYGGAIGGPPGAIIGGLAGAGLGAFGGEILRQGTNAVTGQPNQLDPARAAEEANANMVGQMVGGVAGKVIGKASPVAKEGFRRWRYGPVVQQIEQKLGPKGKEAQATAIDIAESLAKDPVLAKAAKGKPFDTAVFSRYQSAKVGMDAAEEAIPAGTVVPKPAVLSQIDTAIKELQVLTPSKTVPAIVKGPLGQNINLSGATKTVENSISGHEDALRVLTELRAKVAQFGKDIPYQDLRKFRMQLDKNVKVSGGFKETATAADRAAVQANKFVSDAIRGEMAKATSAMTPANAEFSLMSRAMETAGLDFGTGRRLADVGKIPPSMLVKLAKAGMLGGTGTASAYTVYRILGLGE